MAATNRRVGQVTLPPLLETPPELSDSACRDVPNPDLFFPIDGDEVGVARAKQLCARCPVRVTCLRLAIVRRERYGVFGGMTAAERRAIERQLTVAAVAA